MHICPATLYLYVNIALEVGGFHAKKHEKMMKGDHSMVSVGRLKLIYIFYDTVLPLNITCSIKIRLASMPEWFPSMVTIP